KLLPLVSLWGFGPEEETQAPTKEQINRALDLVDFAAVEIENSRIRKTKKGVTLDLSAIAKGFAVDELLKLLKARGIENLLVEIGGEVRVLGRNPKGKRWLIGIEAPRAALMRNEEIIEAVALYRGALATSG